MGTMEASTATTTPAEPAEPATDAPGGSEASSAAAVGDMHTSHDAEETGDERDESGRYLSREAASYRRRLRETEHEHDELRTQLDRLQTGEVERLAGDAGLQVPGDIWSFGAELANLRGEDGGIDQEAVSGLVGEIVKDRPGLQARPTGDIGIGRGAGATGTRTEQTVGLSQLLKPER
jgi:hypothetical protein